MMRYRCVVATRLGGPEVLRVEDRELRPPAAREARIRVLVSAVSRPDITVRSGRSLYNGTPLGQKPPFVPGYAVIGEVDAVGSEADRALLGARVGVLCVLGGYSEYLYWRSDRLIPVPRTANPVEAVTLILNYLVAYQTLHRCARVKRGETALVIGASGGIGTALLQLGRLAGLSMYGVASGGKQEVVMAHGAVPIDYRIRDFADVVRRAEPEGIDAVMDGMMSPDSIRGGMSLLRRGGRMVCYGEPARGLPGLMRILGKLAAARLTPDGKSLELYGTSKYFVLDRRPFDEDWRILFEMLARKEIRPVIAAVYPLLDAAKANELLEGGSVAGNVVLAAPEILQPQTSTG